MPTGDRIEAFESWLKRHGTHAQRAMFSRSVVQGFVALAAGQRIEPEHVARGVRFAREAGMSGIAEMEQLGSLFLEFEASEAGETGARPPSTAASDLPLADAPLAEIAVDDSVAPAAPEPTASPLVITIRMPTSPVIAPSAEERPSVEEPALAEERVSAEQRPSAPRRRRPLVAAGAVAAVGVAVVVAVMLRSGDPNTSRSAAPAQTTEPVLRLAPLQLTARVPAGWREAPPSELAGAGSSAGTGVPTSLVIRGEHVDDPDEAAFLASLPIGGQLSRQPTDAALLDSVRSAERGAIAQLDAEYAAYRSAGCRVEIIDGHRVGACRGTAARRGVQASLHTYVRVIGDREVVALFLAKRGPGAAPSDTGRIVGSLAP